MENAKEKKLELFNVSHRISDEVGRIQNTVRELVECGEVRLRADEKEALTDLWNNIVGQLDAATVTINEEL